jgi:hypothetical protein
MAAHIPVKSLSGLLYLKKIFDVNKTQHINIGKGAGIG